MAQRSQEREGSDSRAQQSRIPEPHNNCIATYPNQLSRQPIHTDCTENISRLYFEAVDFSQEDTRAIRARKMLNGGGGGTGRLENWELKGREEIMCVFLAEDEIHKRLLKQLISRIEQFDRITGKDIGFLLLFPTKKNDKIDDDDDFRCLADILSTYKIEYLATHHMSGDTVDALREQFRIPFEKLPIILVFVRGLPEEPYAFELPKEATVADLEDWFRGLRKVSDRLKAIPNEDFARLPINALEKGVRKAEAFDISIGKKTKKFANVLTDFANRNHLGRPHRWDLAAILGASGPLIEYLSATLGKIEASLAPEKVESLRNDKMRGRLMKLASEIDSLKEKQCVTLHQSLEVAQLDDLLAFEKQKANRILEEVSALSFKSKVGIKGRAIVRTTSVLLASLQSRITYVTRLVASAKKFAGLIP